MTLQFVPQHIFDGFDEVKVVVAVVGFVANRWRTDLFPRVAIAHPLLHAVGLLRVADDIERSLADVVHITVEGHDEPGRAVAVVQLVEEAWIWRITDEVGQ